MSERDALVEKFKKMAAKEGLTLSDQEAAEYAAEWNAMQGGSTPAATMAAPPPAAKPSPKPTNAAQKGDAATPPKGGPKGTVTQEAAVKREPAPTVGPAAPTPARPAPVTTGPSAFMPSPGTARMAEPSMRWGTMGELRAAEGRVDMDSARAYGDYKAARMALPRRPTPYETMSYEMTASPEAKARRAEREEAYAEDSERARAANKRVAESLGAPVESLRGSIKPYSEDARSHARAVSGAVVDYFDSPPRQYSREPVIVERPAPASPPASSTRTQDVVAMPSPASARELDRDRERLAALNIPNAHSMSDARVAALMATPAVQKALAE